MLRQNNTLFVTNMLPRLQDAVVVAGHGSIALPEHVGHRATCESTEPPRPAARVKPVEDLAREVLRREGGVTYIKFKLKNLNLEIMICLSVTGIY